MWTRVTLDHGAAANNVFCKIQEKKERETFLFFVYEFNTMKKQGRFDPTLRLVLHPREEQGNIRE